jgi:predicted small integral membrane protein
MDLVEVGYGDVDWIGLPQDRDRWRVHVNSVLNLRFVGKTPRGKGPLGRPKRRWLDNIRMDLVEVGYGDVDWIGLAQDRDRWRALVNSVLNLRFVGWKARGKEATRKTKA